MTEKKLEKRDSKGLIDNLMRKVISRKLLVWGTATVALFMDVVPSADWIQICLLYIGSQALVDMISGYVTAKNSTNE